MYNEYCNYVIQEGLFGFGMININDSRVPANVMVDFGYVDNGKVKMPYIVKMPVFFQTDNKHRIHKKQLDSINQSVERNVWGGSFPDMVLDYLQKNYPNDVKDVTDVWQVVTPKRLLVPVDPMDSFVVLLEVEYDFDDKPDYWKWSSKINGGSKKSLTNSSDAGFTNDSNIAASLNGFKSKKDVIKESFELKRPNRFGSVVQEAIDFGEGDSTNSDANTPPSSDNMSLDSNPNVSVDSDSTQSVDSQLNGTNDVSNDIANKVSEELANAENDNNPTDVQSDDLSVSDEPDLPTDDSTLEEPTSDNMGIDQQIDDLGGGTDGGVSSNIDVDNMTLDELIEQGTQRLKGMTLAQIKDFLNGSDNASIDGIDEPNETAESLQEAFINGTDEDIFQEVMILTKKNINRTIDVSLRNTLGILNDNEKDVNTIITEFKKEGKKLNKILSKAAKMKNVYDDNERSEIASLNKCLVDLMAIMKTSDMKSDAATVKRMIKAFAAQAAVVAKIVEGKSGNKTVQESVVSKTDTLNNPNVDLPKEYEKWLSSATKDVFSKTYLFTYDNPTHRECVIKLFNKSDVAKRISLDDKIRKSEKDHYSTAFIAVGETPNGDMLLVNRFSGRVYFWDHETVDQIILASSWNKFINELKDNKGVK